MSSRKTVKKGRGKKAKKSKTLRNTISNRKKSLIVRTFLEMLNTVKLYHWKTRSYSQHKATDELYEHLNSNVDKFVEILLGKDESRVKMVERRCELMDFSKGSDFKERIYEYREFLVDMNRYFDGKRDTDLLNIRDEILGDINQFLYLMTFR
jgi:DNA-binding ferritin-like protein